MFTTFVCDEPAHESATDQGRVSPPNKASSYNNTQFSRTSCDICRARAVECRGTGDTCDGCIASSNACTYTFSSGVGPGKRRRRKVWSPTLNTGISQQRPISSSRSSSHGYEGRSRTRNARSEQRSHESTYLQDMSNMAMEISVQRIGDGINTVNDDNTALASVQDWSDISLSGDGFALCPGDHMSATPHQSSQPQSLLHMQPNPESADRSDATSSLDPDILQMFEISSPQLRSDTLTAQASRQNSSDQSTSQPRVFDLTPPFTPKPTYSTTSGFRPDNTNTVQEKAFAQSNGLFSQCDRHASMFQKLDDIDFQRRSDIKVALTDTLFLAVEKGIDQFSTMLSCDECNVNDINPMVVVTSVNQLALTLSEIVHRLTHCQTPDTVPAMFQFGRYCVLDTKMRTRLLSGMIELHVRRLKQMIIRLGTCITEQTRLLLTGAMSIVTKMQKTLEDFPNGTHTDYDD